MSRNTHILVVDDFAGMRRIIHNLLVDLGYSNIVEAGSGAAALQVARAGGLGLIITDWNMPSMTGLELLEQVRSSPCCSAVPVLMVTAQASRDEILAAAKAGVSDYIIKPFTTATLKRKIDGVLGVAGAGEAAGNDAPPAGDSLADPAALADFLPEAHACIANLESDLAALDPVSVDAAVLTRVMRGFHTIKGTAGFLGLEAVVHLCHAAEELVGHGPAATQLQAAQATLAAIDVALDAAASPPSTGAPGPSSDPQEPPGARADPLPLLRVELRKVERLSRLVDALACTCDRLVHGSDADSAMAPVSLPDLKRAVDAVAGAVEDVRLRPVHQLFEPVLRLAQQLAGRLGKQVHVATGGDALEIDGAVTDALSVPLVHLMRNALDHGIESPDRRQRAGKPACGTIQIDASRSEGTVTIQFRDDGAGIDPGAVRNKAVGQGLLTPQDAASMSDADALALVFRPGLSMLEAATDLSGRGMGLDIVRHAVETAGGHVEVASTYGSGSTFRLCVPTSAPRTDSAS